jgi:radical SAM superfamily enzyme YgiQ (UPF0313 family)
MLTLVNTNRMTPPIAPVGLDYMAGAARQAGIEVEILDLCLANDAGDALKSHFAGKSPELVGLSFRNVDDCFWPSCDWFVPELAETVKTIRTLSDSPTVIGGVGFSIFPERIVEQTGADFGIRGDGEQAIVVLAEQLRGQRRFECVEGLIWRDNGSIRSNKPAWPTPLTLDTSRDAIDNTAYFKNGGQLGLETKRGCNQKCIYCADPLAKGTKLRLRNPAQVADEAEALLAKGIDVLHLCDSEFNIPRSHAMAVCAEFTRRGLGRQLRWYTYMAVVPFDTELAQAMRRAGCVGIDFTGDAGCPAMLKTYCQGHTREDLADSVRLCKDNGMMVMVDLLLGGPGETPQTVAETIGFIKRIEPDCAGAPLGVRIYPGTGIEKIVMAEGSPEANPNIRKKYAGSVDFFRPTFYISSALGERPAELVKDLIAGDRRFFEPVPDVADSGTAEATDHNYNDNTELVAAIQKGARGAYWHILHNLRSK